MFAKQQNSSRIQSATKPLLILLPLMCGTSLIARGRRTQSASSVTVQQDTGQYRSGGGSDPEEASFEYAGLENSGTEFVFNYTPSSEAKTDTERINEAKQLFKTTALYRYVIKPLGMELGDDWIDEDAANGRMVFNPCELADLMSSEWDVPVEFFHQNVESKHANYASKEPCSTTVDITESPTLLRDSVFTIEKLKNHLGQIWLSLKGRWVSQISKRCMVTIYTNDNKIYLAESDHFTLIKPDGNLSSDTVNEIKDIAHIYAIRLEDAADTPPSGFDLTHAIDIDLAKPYGTRRVS